MTIELAGRLEETPAIGVAGVLAKMQIAISLFPRLDDTSGFHEDFTIAVRRDGGGAVMSPAASRRTLLAGATALLTAAGAVRAAAAATSPDAALLTLCARFHALHAKALATGDDDAMHAVMGQRWDTSDEIEEIAPQTPEGMRAKAGVALALLDENGRWEVSSDTQFAYAVLRNMAGPA